MLKSGLKAPKKKGSSKYITAFRSELKAGPRRGSLEYYSASLEDSYSFARKCVPFFEQGPAVLCLEGDLGAGKTTFVSALVHHLHAANENRVTSPTYSYLNTYIGNPIVHHFDLFRLKNEADFISMDFDEYFFSKGICCIEWPERISKIIPVNAYYIYIEYLGENSRKFYFDPPG